MCGIAGALLDRHAHDGDVAEARRMILRQTHRGPDGLAARRVGPALLASSRLAIVDVANGSQPFSDESRTIHAVFNGEIYNHLELREHLSRRGHSLSGGSDGEVIVHLYEEYGTDCFQWLDGQFAIAIFDSRDDSLHLARDRMGICPLHWARLDGALYFSSEIKGLLAVAGMPRRAEPRAMLQLAYFGAVCAPLTPFGSIHQLPAAHRLSFRAGRLEIGRYWSLDFPLAGEHARLSEAQAAEGLAARLERAVASHAQGEFEPTCFLSGGIDSAVIAALLQRRSQASIAAFCAASEHGRMDEGGAAARTAEWLGVDLKRVCIDEAGIADAFPRLIWHGETPVISTEASALMRLAGEAGKRSKIVLTGEGADEAFAGYLAFRQYRQLGALTGRGLSPLRTMVRPWLRGHYGSECLLPGEDRLGVLAEHFGCVPAQAYEWEFYREALTPLFSPELRAMAAAGGCWDGFEFDRGAVRGRHWLDRSLYVSYQVMLPNYLLGAHGDRIYAAHSVEGRYPFLDRALVEYAAALDPALKLRRGREKHILRVAAARWLPDEVAWRPKTRFVMPFGTPFVGPRAAPLFAELLSPGKLAEYGYFDPERVRLLFRALASPPSAGGKARRYLERLALGLGATFVVSAQLWHHLHLADGGSAVSGEAARRSAPATIA
ncbi:asparagine synthase (glutamine-hydrolyzing) [Chromobacterium violaceum]|uniref:asparagine synthase (glutamine-hydrolyzing) n=1 Tax=Chromobacterium violaceum TaxID=536 RepID=UPI001CE0F22C|nr:asparagine synthase (glutamine-hydrolyzing) [Chromobacterium violaceum]